MRRSLQSLAADVIALQEVDRRVFRSWFRDQTQVAGRATGMWGSFAAARPFGPGGRFGNALLVRGVATDCQVLELESAAEQRVALFATLCASGEPVTVICTHLQNRRPGQVEEAPGQLRQVLAEAAQRPGPLVLCGDLNLRAPTVEPMLAEAGMFAVDSGPTFPSDRPRLRIDWIAVRGIGVLSSEVPDLRTSDHRPLVATLAPLPSRDVSEVLTNRPTRADRVV